MAKNKNRAKRSASKTPVTKKPEAKRAQKKPASKKSVAKAKTSKRPAAKKSAKKSAAKTKRPAAKRSPTRRSPSGAIDRPQGRPALEIAEEVFGSLGMTMSRTDGEIVRWDVSVAPEDHFEIVVQLIGDEQLVLYSIFRDHVAPERMPQMLEMIARVNHGLLIGGYEIDLDDGFVRLKVSLDFKGAPLDSRLLANLVTGARDVSDVYDEAILSVMQGVASAREALERVEGTE